MWCTEVTLKFAQTALRSKPQPALNVLGYAKFLALSSTMKSTQRTKYRRIHVIKQWRKYDTL